MKMFGNLKTQMFSVLIERIWLGKLNNFKKQKTKQKVYKK